MRRPARAGDSTRTPWRRRASPKRVRVSDMAPLQTVAVIGAGAWGTALAGVALRAGRDVVLYARNGAHAAEMIGSRENPRLPGIALDTKLEITSDIVRAARAEIVLVATPAQHL